MEQVIEKSVENSIDKTEKNTINMKETEFSDLVKEKYLPKIGELIGKTLSPQMCGREEKVNDGTFPCDLYIKMPDGKAVVIENQYGASNHDHLGKLFTYATMFTPPNYQRVTDVVWIIIDNKVHYEHRNALEVINRLCEEKGIEFKMWLLIANRKDEEFKEFTFRPADDGDLWKKGEGEPLHQFMDLLAAKIAQNGFAEPGKGGGKCLEIAHHGKDYEVNIPYRTTEERLKIEVKFTKNTRKYVAIEENYQTDLEEWCETTDFPMWDASKYGFCFERIPSKNDENGTATVVGGFPMKIENESQWVEYISEALFLLVKITKFADYLADRYEK